MNPEISLIVPMYNEAEGLDLFFSRVISVMTQLNVSYEVICINDGSRDATLAGLIRHHAANPAIKIINLSRNFGKELAMTAGLDHATGCAIIPIDADLQDPPELIGDLIAKWREGYDMVYATRAERHGETWVKRLTANWFYKFIGKISEIPIPANTGDFRLMDRCVVNAIKQLPERTRFMKGLFAWAGFRQTAIIYDRDPRAIGQTKWNYWRLWNFALDGIVSFSVLPLKIWSYLGFVFSFFAFLYASFLILRTFIFGIDLPGYASTISVVLFLGGIQLISLGIIGEYLSRIYIEVKGRPLYFVQKLYGFEKSIN